MADGPRFPYRIEPRGPGHDHAAFDCGVAALDGYLSTQAGQDARRRVAACFVLVPAQGNTVAGYYTLSAASLALADLPPEIARKLPRYPAVPATLMGRLAMDRRHQGRGLGEVLLMNAFARCLAAKIASFAFVVEAKHVPAAAFYRHFGFRPLIGDPRRLFLPMAEVARLFT